MVFWKSITITGSARSVRRHWMPFTAGATGSGCRIRPTKGYAMNQSHGPWKFMWEPAENTMTSSCAGTDQRICCITASWRLPCWSQAILLFQAFAYGIPKYCDNKGNIDPAELDELLPWFEKLPDECRKSRRWKTALFLTRSVWFDAYFQTQFFEIFTFYIANQIF